MSNAKKITVTENTKIITKLPAIPMNGMCQCTTYFLCSI